MSLVAEVDKNVIIDEWDANADEEVDASPDEIQNFVQWAVNGSKHYQRKSEFKKRLENWKNSDKRIQELNEYEKRSGGKIIFKHNFASDLDDWEFKKMQGLGRSRAELASANMADLELDINVGGDGDDMKKGKLRGNRNGKKLKSSSLSKQAVNWVASGKVLPIKDQGEFCGSCWAFTANTVLESTLAIRTDTKPEPLSIQYALDCTYENDENIDRFGKPYGNTGCDGGWMDNLWKFNQEFGAMKEKDYPTKYDFMSEDMAAKQCHHIGE